MNLEAIELDLIGVECPDFSLSVRAFIRKAAPKTKLLVKSSVHNATRDIKALCTYGNHNLISIETTQENKRDITLFLIEKGE